ncbi:MAG: DUF4174 domain-containing protein [Eudoraea sp.]|uniref:DUF4174 domain-containing protein n=1 Tax=Eudoraea sp. TaxID=1979955 RepID=UPI003C7101EF
MGNGQELSSFRWEKRLVIIVDTIQKNTYSNQIKLFTKSPEELEERDILLFYYDGKNLLDTSGKNTDLHLPEGMFQKDSELILIGKDGSIKMRSPLPIDPKEVFQTIDQMPMRRSEIKKGQP